MGELFADAAGHAQGIVRAEVRLAFAQMRNELQAVARRLTLQGGAVFFAFAGTIALMIAGALALHLVVAAWLAVLIIGGVTLLMAVVLFGVAGRSSAALTDVDAVLEHAA
ncbi:phage holin family protein [Gemmatimonas sp.]